MLTYRHDGGKEVHMEVKKMLQGFATVLESREYQTNDTEELKKIRVRDYNQYKFIINKLYQFNGISEFERRDVLDGALDILKDYNN